MADLEDRALIREMAKGDVGALEKLYDRYADLLFSFAVRMVGEPSVAGTLVELTYAAAWRMAAEIAEQRGTVRDWLISHVHTAGIERVHQQRAPSRHDGAAAARQPNGVAVDEPQILQPLHDLDVEFRQIRELVKELMRGLSHHRRHAVDLAYFQGYSQEEISPLVQQPLLTVERDLAGTLALLSQALEESGAEQTVE